MENEKKNKRKLGHLVKDVELLSNKNFRKRKEGTREEIEHIIQ